MVKQHASRYGSDDERLDHARKQYHQHCGVLSFQGERCFSNLGPYLLTNHSEALVLEASNMVFSSPSRPTFFAMMSDCRDSPASKHLSALLISRSISSTLSAECRDNRIQQCQIGDD
jgi:hypothetical protein